MDLDDPHHVRGDVHIKYAGKSERREKYKVKKLYDSQTVIYNSNNLQVLHANVFIELFYRQL